jgi:hypothetical protein
MKTVIVGKLTKVEESEQKEKYKQQRIEVTVKEFDTTSGALKSESVFPMTIFNTKIESMNCKASLSAQVAVTCYIRSIKSEKDGKIFHNLALNAVEIKEV